MLGLGWKSKAKAPVEVALRAALIDYETHPYISPIFARITEEEKAQALATFLPAFVSDIEAALRKKEIAPRRGELRPESLPVFDRLWSDGAVSFRIAPELKKRLVQAMQPMIAATEEKLNAKGVTTKMADNRTGWAPKDQPEVAKLLDEILEDLDIKNLAKVYYGRPVIVPHLSLLINQAANMDKVFNATYAAWGIKPQKAVYYHVDSMFGCSLKMMLYISEVGMDNGPFQYVMGSARAADPMDLLIRKRGDKLKFSHRQIMALPKEFRRKSHFGFDLLDDMPETDRYLQNEKSFCSSEGDLVLFDANGIHRGGIVKTERRVALSLLLA